MEDEALDAVRVTAQRVRRFVNDVERETTEDARYLWRASLEDLRASIRHARSEGFDTADIQEATDGKTPGRFERSPKTAENADPAPQPSPPAA